MTTPPGPPRKQRTRQHVIADLSIHHIEGFILAAGHTVQRMGSDYGYDLIMWTFDEDGYAEPGLVYFQLKAMERVNVLGGDCVFDLDVRDYNLWAREEIPVILVLYDAGRMRAVWLMVQQYLASPGAPKPRKAAKTVRIRIPERSVLSRRAIATIRKMKRQSLDRPKRAKAMKRSRFTYGELGEVLRSFGFVCQRFDDPPPALRYVHEPTGALVSVPPYPDSEPLYPHHLVAARTTLDLYGITDPEEFDARLWNARAGRSRADLQQPEDRLTQEVE